MSFLPSVVWSLSTTFLEFHERFPLLYVSKQLSTLKHFCLFWPTLLPPLKCRRPNMEDIPQILHDLRENRIRCGCLRVTLTYFEDWSAIINSVKQTSLLFDRLSIELWETSFSDRDMTHDIALKRLTSLPLPIHSLSLFSIKDITVSDVVEIMKFPIQHLRLRYCTWSMEAWDLLVQGIRKKQLHSLDLTQNSYSLFPTNTHMYRLKKLPYLTCLRLYGCNVSYDGFVHLRRELPHLKHLDVRYMSLALRSEDILKQWFSEDTLEQLFADPISLFRDSKVKPIGCCCDYEVFY